MTTVTVHRTNTYINRFRQCALYIDGKKVATIANGQTLDFDLAPGHHTIQAKIDWCGSPEIAFNAEVGTTSTFELDGFKNNREILWLILVLVFANLLAEKIFAVDFLNYILIPGLLLIALFLIFGRNKYLKLSRVEGGR